MSANAQTEQSGEATICSVRRLADPHLSVGQVFADLLIC